MSVGSNPSPQSRRIVALEEAFLRPDLIARIPPEIIRRRGWPEQRGWSTTTIEHDGGVNGALADVGDGRISAMDAAGISLQVLSSGIPGPELLAPRESIEMAREYNDGLKVAVDSRPGRFAGFATLPMPAPEAAADELERAVTDLGFVGALVNGTTNGLFLDDDSFEPVLARAESLDVPIYIHPNLPPAAVSEAYYSGLPGLTGFLLSMGGWGWHAETATHVLRLVLSGALERHPSLKLIVGHMGEGLPAMLDRFDDTLTPHATHLTRSVGQTILDQVWVTTSGIFSIAAFHAALLTFGVDRILFSVDYPYSGNQQGVEFLENLPVSPDDRARIAAGNADELLRLG